MVKELHIVIMKLENGKSQSANGFTAEWYKALKEAVTPTLLAALNHVLREGDMLPSWRQATIAVIYSLKRVRIR